MAVVVEQPGILCRFPNEIIENIIVELVFIDPLGPPKSLIPVLSTCRRLYNCLVFDRCPHLYARLFKLKFDLAAVRRRFGPRSVRSTNLAKQFKIYCINLQDIRRGDIYSPNIHHILRTAFFIAIENDGKNAYQLEWAGLDGFVDRFVRARLCENVAQHNNWPAESSINAIALWLMWFTTTWEKLAAESLEQRQQIIDLVLPYVVLPFRYPAAYAPSNHFVLPLSSTFKRRYPHSVITAHGPYPLYRETHLILEDLFHYNRFLEFSLPLITVAAKLLYFARREMVPIGIPPHLPIDRAHALALGRTYVQPTQADVHEVNGHRSVKTVKRRPWDYIATMSEEEKEIMDNGLWTPTLTSASSMWDPDWNRITFCHDPWDTMPLKGQTYTHGMLNGLWQGRMLVPVEGAYMSLIMTPNRPPGFGEGSPQLTTVPLFMRLREHHSISPQVPILTGGRRNGFDDGLENAWLPTLRFCEDGGNVTATDEQGNVSIYHTYVPGQPSPHNEETCHSCISEKAEAEKEMRQRSASLSDPELPAIPPMDSEIEGIFSSYGLGPDDNMEADDDEDDDDMSSVADSDSDTDSEEIIQRSCSGIQDLLLTGETDISHGQAWNHYIFYGRIRRWDGLIALVRVPRHINGREHRHLGRWVFTGYVVGGQTFVGTWRALRNQDVGVPTWESAFSVSRRD